MRQSRARREDEAHWHRHPHHPRIPTAQGCIMMCLDQVYDAQHLRARATPSTSTDAELDRLRLGRLTGGGVQDRRRLAKNIRASSRGGSPGELMLQLERNRALPRGYHISHVHKYVMESFHLTTIRTTPPCALSLENTINALTDASLDRAFLFISSVV